MRHEFPDASCGLLGEFFATLAHATRMRIMCVLQQGPLTVTEIAAHAGITIPNASQHLRMMRERGAVIAEKQAQNVHYRIADPRILEAMQLIRWTLTERLRINAKQASAGSPRRVAHRALQAS
jgi:ArsR family transcriptional regulator